MKKTSCHLTQDGHGNERADQLETPGLALRIELRLSPDGTRLAAAIDSDKRIALWDFRRLRQELAQQDLERPDQRAKAREENGGL